MYRWTKITQKEMEVLYMSAESAVYYTLKMFMGSGGVAYPSAATIARLTGLSVHSVRKSTKTLLEKGLIVRDGFDPNNQTARFKLADEGTNQSATPTNQSTTPNTVVSRGGTNQSTTPPNTVVSTNKEKTNKNINNKEPKKPNPFFLVPRID